MSYDLFSEYAPINNSGTVSASYARTIPNNPANVDATDSMFPNYYDQFVNKTEGRSDAPVFVVGEPHSPSEIDYVGSIGFLTLHHSILRSDSGASVVSSDGVINLSASDFSNGILAYSVVPSGNFIVNYLAVQDALYGEHINAIQNSLMSVQSVLGAGSVSGEGIRNATVWVKDYPASTQRVLPNAIHTESLEQNVTIKGEAGSSRTITLGNGLDKVTIDVAQFNITSSDPSAVISGNIGDSNADVMRFNCPVAILATGGVSGGLLPTGTFAGAAFSVGNPNQSTWSGATAGPYAKPETGANQFPIARFFGDVHVVGDLFIQGTTQVFSSLTGAQVSQINDILQVNEDLRVSGDSVLGMNSNTTTTVGGDLTVGGYLDVQGNNNDISQINTPVFVKNQGNNQNSFGGSYDSTIVPAGTQYIPDLPYYVGQIPRRAPGTINDRSANKHFHIDGLDPSYIAKSLALRAHDRKDWKNNCVNIGPYQGYSGTVTAVTAPGTTQWTDTGICWGTGSVIAFNLTSGFNPISGAGAKAFRWHHQGGDYYHGKFTNETHTIPSGEFSGSYLYGDGHQWNILWTNDDTSTVNPGARKYGARIPLKKITPSYSTGSPFLATSALVEMSRGFNTTVVAGDTYKVYHPYYSAPNILRKSNSTTITVFASPAEPIIVDCNGITKTITTQCDESINSTYTGYYFVYAECGTPEIAKAFDGSLLESEATIVVTTERTRSESRVPIGEFYAIDPGVGIVDSSIITYRYGLKYDTLWQRVNATGNLYSNASNKEFSYRAYNSGITATSTGLIESGALFTTEGSWGDILAGGANDYRFRVQHNFGSIDRITDADIRVWVAPNYGSDYPSISPATGVRVGPDYAYISELPRVFESGTAGFKVVKVDRNHVDLVINDLSTIQSAVINARSTAGPSDRVLTGATSALTTNGISERERSWWYIRTVIE